MIVTHGIKNVLCKFGVLYQYRWFAATAARSKPASDGVVKGVGTIHRVYPKFGFIASHLTDTAIFFLSSHVHGAEGALLFKVGDKVRFAATTNQNLKNGCKWQATKVIMVPSKSSNSQLATEPKRTVTKASDVKSANITQERSNSVPKTATQKLETPLDIKSSKRSEEKPKTRDRTESKAVEKHKAMDVKPPKKCPEQPKTKAETSRKIVAKPVRTLDVQSHKRTPTNLKTRIPTPGKLATKPVIKKIVKMRVPARTINQRAATQPKVEEKPVVRPTGTFANQLKNTAKNFDEMKKFAVRGGKWRKSNAVGSYHFQIRIESGSIGYSYEKLLGPFIDEHLTAVIVEDPYIKVAHQLVNFVRFCEVLVKYGSNFKKIKLVTSREEVYEEGAALQKDCFESLRQSLAENSVSLIVEYSNTLHDREIRFDSGWTIKIGKGLDIYRSTTNKWSLGRHDYDMRHCYETTVDILFKCPEK